MSQLVRIRGKSRLDEGAWETKAVRFWRVYSLLMKKSNSFLFLSLHNVLPKRYKEMGWNEVRGILVKARQIALKGETEFTVREVGIPKPDGSTRTLSVPKKEWRLYLWLVNFGLHLFTNHRLSDHQHGHRAGRGVMTAWNEIFANMFKYSYIYEFDYRGFHPSIKYEAISDALESFDYPQEVRDWLMKLNNPTIWKTDNSKVKLGRGVPQGVSTYALLGMMVLENLKVYKIRGVNYTGFADDGLILSNKADLVERLKERLDSSRTGIEIKPEKSRLIKEDGVWLSHFKFLGCRFIPKSHELGNDLKGRMNMNYREVPLYMRGLEGVDSSYYCNSPLEDFNRPRTYLELWKFYKLHGPEGTYLESVMTT
jgi:Reverse transcriptase (RNA-dependent DNA polymerase)